jgi:hypothetical protein
MDTVDQEQPQQVQSEQPQQDQPFSLAHHVVYLLEQADVENPEEWMKNLKQEALESADVNVQRFLVNRCWTEMFATLKTKDEILQTRNARGSLMNSGKCSLEDWTHLFRTQVIQCAINVGLLKKKA